MRPVTHGVVHLSSFSRTWLTFDTSVSVHILWYIFTAHTHKNIVYRPNVRTNIRRTCIMAAECAQVTTVCEMCSSRLCVFANAVVLLAWPTPSRLCQHINSLTHIQKQPIHSTPVPEKRTKKDETIWNTTQKKRKLFQIRASPNCTRFPPIWAAGVQTTHNARQQHAQTNQTRRHTNTQTNETKLVGIAGTRMRPASALYLRCRWAGMALVSLCACVHLRSLGGAWCMAGQDGNAERECKKTRTHVHSNAARAARNCFRINSNHERQTSAMFSHTHA